MIRSLKYFTCSVAAIAFYSSRAGAQGLINNGAYIVNSNAYIYIDGGAALGNFTNQDAGAFIGKVDNTGTIGITGDWINNSTQQVFTANTGTVELLGSNQDLGGSNTTWFNNLNLLGTGTKTMQVDELTGGGYALPAGILSLNDRPLDLNSHLLTVNNPLNSAITRTSGYIISETNAANNTSIIQWNVGANNAAYIFPFGTVAAPNYIPLTITKTGGITDIRASTRQTFLSNNQPWHFSVTQMWSQTIPGAGEVPVVIDRWWDIQSTTGFTGAVSFTYRGVENTTTYSPTGTFAAQNWIGTSWDPPVGSGPGVLAGTAVVSIPAQALGSATPWVLSNVDAPLPVELLFFNAELSDNTVQLQWSTSSEINNAYFEIQRSRDNSTFETIDAVDGAGNSTSVKSYHAADSKPYPGISYYRLRQVDFDGKFTFSQTVSVRLENKSGLNLVFVVPSETGGHITIGYESFLSSHLTLRISNALGKSILVTEINPSDGFNKNEIQTPDLSGGIYYISISSNSEIETRKFFVK